MGGENPVKVDGRILQEVRPGGRSVEELTELDKRKLALVLKDLLDTEIDAVFDSLPSDEHGDEETRKRMVIKKVLDFIGELTNL